MTKLVLVPSKLLAGLALSGLVMWGGWKLGRYFGEVARGERESPWRKIEELFEQKETPEPLWKRQYSPVSDS
ncbi:hypothetical protein ACFL2Q_14545 [Thermodesulfobacteriota bacterium]